MADPSKGKKPHGVIPVPIPAPAQKEWNEREAGLRASLRRTVAAVRRGSGTFGKYADAIGRYNPVTWTSFVLSRPFAILRFAALTRSAFLTFHRHARDLDDNYQKLHLSFRTAFDNATRGVMASRLIRVATIMLADSVSKNAEEKVKKAEERAEEFYKKAVPSMKIVENTFLGVFDLFMFSVQSLVQLYLEVLQKDIEGELKEREEAHKLFGVTKEQEKLIEEGLQNPWGGGGGIILMGEHGYKTRANLEATLEQVREALINWSEKRVRNKVKERFAEVGTQVMILSGMKQGAPEEEGAKPQVDIQTQVADSVIEELEKHRRSFELAFSPTRFNFNLSVGFRGLSRQLTAMAEHTKKINKDIAPAITATADLANGFSFLASQAESLAKKDGKSASILAKARLFIQGVIGAINAVVQIAKAVGAFPNIPKMVAHIVAAGLFATAATFSFIAAGSGGGVSVNIPQIEELQKNRGNRVGSVTLVVDDSMFAAEREEQFITRNILIPITSGIGSAPEDQFFGYNFEKISSQDLVAQLFNPRTLAASSATQNALFFGDDFVRVIFQAYSKGSPLGLLGGQIVRVIDKTRAGEIIEKVGDVFGDAFKSVQKKLKKAFGL